MKIRLAFGLFIIILVLRWFACDPGSDKGPVRHLTNRGVGRPRDQRPSPDGLSACTVRQSSAPNGLRRQCLGVPLHGRNGSTPRQGRRADAHLPSNQDQGVFQGAHVGLQRTRRSRSICASSSSRATEKSCSTASASDLSRRPTSKRSDSTSNPLRRRAKTAPPVSRRGSRRRSELIRKIDSAQAPEQRDGSGVRHPG